MYKKHKYECKYGCKLYAYSSILPKLPFFAPEQGTVNLFSKYFSPLEVYGLCHNYTKAPITKCKQKITAKFQ